MDDKAREAFEAALSQKPGAMYWNTADAMLWAWTAALQWAASQQAAEGWRQIGWTCGDGDCGRIHDGPSTDDDYTQPVYVRAAPPATQGGADA